MMSSYYHPAKEADMASMTEPLCLERGRVILLPRPLHQNLLANNRKPIYHLKVGPYARLNLNLPNDDETGPE